jgi:glutathione S-transferase
MAETNGSAIFHITSETEWAAARHTGELRSSTRDRSLDDEGFIAVERLHAQIRYENLDGGAAPYPHVYGPVQVDAVVSVAPLSRGQAGTFDLGDEVST